MTGTKQLPDLSGFIGGGDQYRHWLGRLTYTEGVYHLAETVGAHWLIDAIASHQGPRLDRVCEGMQFWELTVRADKTALLTCVRDRGEPYCVRQEIPFTDFPQTREPFRLWVEFDCLMLPQER